MALTRRQGQIVALLREGYEIWHGSHHPKRAYVTRMDGLDANGTTISMETVRALEQLQIIESYDFGTRDCHFRLKGGR